MAVSFPSKSEGLIRVPLAQKLPDDIWPRILKYLSDDSNLCHITAMASVSKRFLDLCLNLCRIHITFGSTNFIEAKSLVRLQYIEYTHRRRLLTVDAQGRHYSAHKYLNVSYILYITDLTTMKRMNLNLGSVEFPEELKKSPNFWENMRIINCHPTKEGFILVTQGGCSVWEWDSEGKPLFRRYASAFEGRSELPEMGCSILYGDKVLIRHGLVTWFQMLDLKDPGSKFLDIEVSEQVQKSVNAVKPNFLSTYLHQTEDNLCLVYQNEGQGKNTVYSLTLELIQNETGYMLEQVTAPTSFFDGILSFGMRVGTWARKMRYDMAPVSSSNWTLYFQTEFGRDKRNSLIFVTHKGALWMGSEFDLRIPSSKEHYFIYEDFLFLSYQDGTFRLIHLPTKQDYSFNSQVLNDYLAEKKAALYWISIESSPTEYPLLKLIVSWTGALYEVKIPMNLNPKNRKVNPKGGRDHDSEKVTQQLFQKIQKELPSSCTHKITFWVGIALFILTGAGTAALIILHPGTVIYEGNGVILTLPAVLTLSLGGSAALITIAIGSYLWWKERSTAP